MHQVPYCYTSTHTLLKCVVRQSLSMYRPKYPKFLFNRVAESLWGMPIGRCFTTDEFSIFMRCYSIGEFFDLEKLSEVCAETRRYTFFFSSWPLNMYAARDYLLLQSNKLRQYRGMRLPAQRSGMLHSFHPFDSHELPCRRPISDLEAGVVVSAI